MWWILADWPQVEGCLNIFVGMLFVRTIQRQGKKVKSAKKKSLQKGRFLLKPFTPLNYHFAMGNSGLQYGIDLQKRSCFLSLPCWFTI